MSGALRNLHHKIRYRLLYFLEPMGHIRRNDDDVTLGEDTSHATFHRGNSDFAGSRLLPTYNSSSGGKGRGPFQDIEDVGVFGVDFDLSRFIPMEDMYAIVPLGIPVI